MRRVAVMLLGMTALGGGALSCGDDSCVTVPEEGCAPLYQPTFDNVFNITLQPTCGASGSACHAPEGAQAGLVFADIDDSHALLTQGTQGTQGTSGALAIGGDAACSPLMGRLAAEDDADVMPPGARLSDQELCAISLWIAAGAPR